jgi:hypothetical protein
VSEVRSGTYPDLEDRSLSERDDSRADIPERLGIAEKAYEMRVDAVSVEGHSVGSSLSPIVRQNGHTPNAPYLGTRKGTVYAYRPNITP